MKIIIRSIGERTEKECIRRAMLQGEVDVIRAYPFGEAIRQTYLLAMTYNQKWIPIIDADVLLFDGYLEKAIKELNRKPDNVFCLDGKTKDKIMMKTRRAGIHIYRTALLQTALRHINNEKIKPESNVRRKMTSRGFPTYTGGIVFGLHDYEQYYRDLWRKSVCQTRKLKEATKKLEVWKKLLRKDLDYLVIYHAHLYGRELITKITIDARLDYGATEGLRNLGIQEKEEYTP